MGITVNVKTASGMVPMTVPIQDENRAMLAYSMLSYIGENRGQFSVGGQEVEVNRDQLVLLDENKNVIEPAADPELFGTEEDNAAAKAEALMKAKQEAIEAGEGDWWDDEEEAAMQDLYTVNSYDREDHSRIWFAPNVWDYDKANDMYNVMNHALDSNVTLMFSRNPEQGYDPEPVAVIPEDVCVSNTDGDVLEKEDNLEWANENAGEELMLTDDDLRGLGGPGDLGLAQ